MCDYVTEQQIKNTVHNLVVQGAVFTAFDVTKELRKADPTFSERHKAVRNLIHSLFSNGEINCERTITPLNIDGVVLDVVVYHPISKLPTEHYLADSPTAPQMPSNDTDEDSVELTKDNRLQIPKHLLDQVSDSDVTIRIGTDTLTMTRNKDGRIRLGISHLASLNKNTFSVSVDPATKEIVIG